MFKKYSFLTQVVVGALVVAAIIASTTIWVSRGARTAANKAVGKVSEFYLQELAGRRSQVVSGVIDSQFEQMGRAIELMKPEDLVSQEALREFIGEIEDLYDLELFAVVDDEDVVYSRYATYMGGSRYDFLTDGQLDDGKVVSSTSLYGAVKQVCLAIPVSGLSLMGRPLKACFVQVDIASIVDTLAFGEEEGDTSFCLYYRNGENLTQLDFGPIAAGENLLDVMQSKIDEDAWDELRQSFYDGEKGSMEFDWDGIKETLYYASIKDTNWVLTVFVADDLIQEQIRGVGSEMIARSAIQIAVTGVALTAYLLSIIVRMRRISDSLLEKERQNTRNASEQAQRSEEELGVIKTIAYKDALTGVRSKYAYTEEEVMIDEAIRRGEASDLAVVACDVNGLKHINDTLGHASGDEYIRAACKLICDLYDHSPVFRIGGDEFVVIVRGTDYEHRCEIFAELNRRVEENIPTGGVVVAAGMAELESDDVEIHSTFHRADQLMYQRKSRLKELGAHSRD